MDRLDLGGCGRWSGAAWLHSSDSGEVSCRSVSGDTAALGMLPADQLPSGVVRHASVAVKRWSLKNSPPQDAIGCGFWGEEGGSKI